MGRTKSEMVLEKPNDPRLFYFCWECHKSLEYFQTLSDCECKCKCAKMFEEVDRLVNGGSSRASGGETQFITETEIDEVITETRRSLAQNPTPLDTILATSQSP